jgi:hypothetical protein
MNRSVPREYSQTTNWNPQSSNYKINSKTAMVPTRTYPQQQQTSYQIPPQQQQQIFFGAYQYPVVQFLAPIEPWPPTGYSTPLESYPYATASKINFLSCFSLNHLSDQIMYQPIPINHNIIHQQNTVNLISV